MIGCEVGEEITRWPQVQEVREDSGLKHITTRDAEAVLRRLLADDAQVTDIEVRRAGLAEAFAEITAANSAAANAAGNGAEKLQ